MTPRPADSASPSQRVWTLLERTEQAREAFDGEHSEEVDAFRHAISNAFGRALSEFQREIAEVSGENPLAMRLGRHAGNYLEWLQWTFWDLPYFAVALRPPAERFEPGLAGCGMVYLSMRLLDDLLDRHYLYRGVQPTLLSTFAAEDGRGKRSEDVVLLTAVLVCLEGVSRLAEEVEGSTAPKLATETLRRALRSSKRTLIGAICEQSPREEWSPDFYERLIQNKNVEYWRILYSSIDPELSSPLYDFLVDYYTLAQRLNDLQEHDRDERWSQPNLISVERLRRAEAGEGLDFEEVMAAVSLSLVEELEALAAKASELPEPEGSIALLKLGESIEETLRIGIFDRPGPAPPREEEPVDPLRMSWESSLDDLVRLMGRDAVREANCQVCGGSERNRLFRKHGFPFYRCRLCDHVYVSPCVTAETQARLSSHQENGAKDPYLEGQRVYADYLCWQLLEHEAGPRLLDLGFGHGYLLLAAQAHGFDVHGLESSRERVEAMKPFFGSRLVQARLEQAELPWDGFDVVVLSHVVEHLPEPRPALEKSLERLRPGGLAYVAVPDMESLDYRLFGKRWDAIHPLVHCQYFHEGSLRRLLDSCGFEVVTRVEPPRFRPNVASRWQRLFRHLGGTESGELALLARRPDERRSSRPASAPEAVRADDR